MPDTRNALQEDNPAYYAKLLLFEAMTDKQRDEIMTKPPDTAAGSVSSSSRSSSRPSSAFAAVYPKHGKSKELLRRALDRHPKSAFLATLVHAASAHDLTGLYAVEARKLIKDLKDSGVTKVCCDIKGSAACASNNTMMCTSLNCTTAHTSRATNSGHAHLAGTGVCAHCVHWHVVLSIFDLFETNGLLKEIDAAAKKISDMDDANTIYDGYVHHHPASSSSNSSSSSGSKS